MIKNIKNGWAGQWGKINAENNAKVSVTKEEISIELPVVEQTTEAAVSMGYRRKKQEKIMLPDSVEKIGDFIFYIPQLILLIEVLLY